MTAGESESPQSDGMSRCGSRTRRKDRKQRAPNRRLAVQGHDFEWGEGPPLTPEQRSRVLQRFSNMRCRSFSVGFVPVFWADAWFGAKNPDELNEAVRSKLLEVTEGSAKN